MVSAVELKDLCDRYHLTPVFSRPFGQNYTCATLNSNNTLPVDVETATQFKRCCDFADYHDIHRPWHPYILGIPGNAADVPEKYRWLSQRLFDCEPHHLVTQTSPYCLTEASSPAIASSLIELKEACSEMETSCTPLLIPFKNNLPPQPKQDILQPATARHELMSCLRNIGPQLLEIIGLCIYLSYRHQFSPECRHVHRILSSFKHPLLPLRGVVVELQSTMLQALMDYLDHCVPVHYLYHDDPPSSCDPHLLNAKDLDSEQAVAHAAFLSSRKKEKNRARDERRSTRAAAPPRQKDRKIFILQDTSKGRFKCVTKNQHANLADLYKGTCQKRPAGDVDILYVNEFDDEDDSDDDALPLDYMFVPQKSWKSSEPKPGPSTLVDTDVPPTRRRSPSVDDVDAPGWSSTFPTPALRPRPPHDRPFPHHQRPGQSSHCRLRSPRCSCSPRRSCSRRNRVSVHDDRFHSHQCSSLRPTTPSCGRSPFHNLVRVLYYYYYYFISASTADPRCWSPYSP